MTSSAHIPQGHTVITVRQTAMKRGVNIYFVSEEHSSAPSTRGGLCSLPLCVRAVTRTDRTTSPRLKKPRAQDSGTLCRNSTTRQACLPTRETRGKHGEKALRLSLRLLQCRYHRSGMSLHVTLCMRCDPRNARARASRCCYERTRFGMIGAPSYARVYESRSRL